MIVALGKGYPAGLKGEAIPIGARLIAVCDNIDAMTSNRPYRKPLTWRDCLREIKTNRADPALVDVVENYGPGGEESGEDRIPGAAGEQITMIYV